MNFIDKAKSIIDKNRLLVVFVVAWIVISNLLYFSQFDKPLCYDISALEGVSIPEWMMLWNRLILGYVALYETISEPYKASLVHCFKFGFSAFGYLSFVSLPTLTIMLLSLTIKWVRRV